MVQRPGFLVVIEGIDGSGKSTQARLLAKQLKNVGLPVIILRERRAVNGEDRSGLRQG